MLLESVILRDTRANQPAAATVPVGSIYYVTDEFVTERNNGASWDDISDSGAAINQLTGDVTAGPGGGSQAATIGNDKVTNVMIRDSGALSVIGRSANSTGDPADISAVAASGSVLRESGSTLGFGTIAAAGIASDAVVTAKILDKNVTYAKIQDVSATDRLLGRDTASSGVTEEIPVTSGLEFTGGPGLRTTDATRTFTLGITIDGGGATISTGVKGYIQVPVAATITSWTILADQSGAIVIDVWKDVFANFPPDNSDAIPSTDEPEIPASGTNATSSSLGSWVTTSIAAGDVIGFNVDSCTSIQRATLQLTCVKTGA